MAWTFKNKFGLPLSCWWHQRLQIMYYLQPAWQVSTTKYWKHTLLEHIISFFSALLWFKGAVNIWWHYNELPETFTILLKHESFDQMIRQIKNFQPEKQAKHITKDTRTRFCYSWHVSFSYTFVHTKWSFNDAW